MASLRDIRNRIRSVKNTQKITKAMKLVAASKLRKAQDAIESARPFGHELGSMLRRVAARADTTEGAAPHPLLEVREPKRVLLVILTSDRGLCGAFNTNIMRMAENWIAENRHRFESLEVATVGRKGRDYFQKRSIATVRDFPGVFDNLAFRRATEITDQLTKEYIEAELDAVYVIFNEFKSAVNQVVRVEPLLPIVQEELPEADQVDYIYEPGQEEVLQELAPRYMSVLLWTSLLESSASEHGARMSAMDSASRNASEILDDLTLKYNRARQAAITLELMDIVGGAEALNG